MVQQSQSRSDEEVPEADSRGLLPPQQRSPFGWVALALALLALAAGGWWYLRGQVPAPAVQALPAPPQPKPVAAASSPAAAASAVPLPEPKVAAGPLDETGVGAALAVLVGPQAARSLLISDGFVRRFVVTVDNLGREHAPPRLWPVPPTPGRFQVIERDGRRYANPDNAARYTPWVLLATRLPRWRCTAACCRCCKRRTRNSATRANASTPG